MPPKKTASLTQGVLGKQIPITYAPKVKHQCEYFPDGHLSFVITGASGCGKSTILCNIIPQITGISQVIICSLITRNAVYDAIRSYCDDREIEFVVYNEPKAAEEGIEEMLASREPGKNSFIVFDDFARRSSNRNDPYTVCMTSVSRMMRNYSCYSAFITQSSTDVPTLVRNNANVRFLFRMNDHHAVRSARDDFVSNGFGSEALFDHLMTKIQPLHSFLMLVNPGKIYICRPGERPLLYTPPTTPSGSTKVKCALPPPLEAVQPGRRSDRAAASYSDSSDDD